MLACCWGVVAGVIEISGLTAACCTSDRGASHCCDGGCQSGQQRLLYKLHTHRGLGGEPGQSERLCEVFTWCRSASDAAGRQDAEKGQEHVYLYTLLKVMDVQCMGILGALHHGSTHNFDRAVQINVSPNSCLYTTHSTEQMFHYLLNCCFVKDHRFCGKIGSFIMRPYWTTRKEIDKSNISRIYSYVSYVALIST